MTMNRRDRPDAAQDSGCKWCRLLLILFIVLILVPGILVLYLAQRFLGDSAVTYANMEDQFKYGSTGGEHEFGFPYWIFQALPQVCAEHLPGKGYASLGFIYEPNK